MASSAWTFKRDALQRLHEIGRDYARPRARLGARARLPPAGMKPHEDRTRHRRVQPRPKLALPHHQASATTCQATARSPRFSAARSALQQPDHGCCTTRTRRTIAPAPSPPVASCLPMSPQDVPLQVGRRIRHSIRAANPSRCVRSNAIVSNGSHDVSRPCHCTPADPGRLSACG